MSYIILRFRWCHIIVLNVHAPREDKTDDVKDRQRHSSVLEVQVILATFWWWWRRGGGGGGGKR
jgi:hypothetical protein